MLYSAPTGSADPNAPYVGKNVAAGTQGSKLPPKAPEGTQREIVNAEMAAGLSPTNGDYTQLAQAMSIGLFLGVVGGTANALAAALPALMPQPGAQANYQIPALIAGMRFHVVVGGNDNTGPVTFSLSGFATTPGAKPVTRKDGASALQASDLAAGSLVTLAWDGTVFRFVGATASDSAKATTYFGTDQGAANTLVVNSLAYGSTLQVGRPILVLIGNTITGPATLNVNSLGAKPIKRPSGFGLADVRANDLRSAQLVQFTYDGTNWQVQSPVPGKQYSYFNQKYAAGGGIMTAADLGSLVQLGVSSGAFTLTLPVCSTCGNGEVISLFHNGNNADVVQCQGADKIVFPDGTAVTSLTMQAGDTIDLLATASTGYFLVVGGSFFTRYSSDFAHNFGSSGWQKLPGGFIVQWLTVTTTSTAGGTTVNLPTSFAGQAFGGVASDTGGSDYTWSVGLNGTGSVVVYAKNSAGNLVSGANGFVLIIGR